MAFQAKPLRQADRLNGYKWFQNRPSGPNPALERGVQSSRYVFTLTLRQLRCRLATTLRLDFEPD
jgi:hypothetical protein